MKTADTPLGAAGARHHGLRRLRQRRDHQPDRGRAAGQADCEAGFLLDGYPRTLQQVDTLDAALAERGKPLDAVVSLLADEDEVVARLLKRAEIEGRADDNEETIRARQQVYADQTAPLLEVYRTRGLLVEVDGLGPIDEVSAAGVRRRSVAGSRPSPPTDRSSPQHIGGGTTGQVGGEVAGYGAAVTASAARP